MDSIVHQYPRNASLCSVHSCYQTLQQPCSAAQPSQQPNAPTTKYPSSRSPPKQYQETSGSRSPRTRHHRWTSRARWPPRRTNRPSSSARPRPAAAPVAAERPRPAAAPAAPRHLVRVLLDGHQRVPADPVPQGIAGDLQVRVLPDELHELPSQARRVALAQTVTQRMEQTTSIRRLGHDAPPRRY